MRHKRAYTDYLRGILDAAHKAERFIAGLAFESFQASATIVGILEALAQSSVRA